MTTERNAGDTAGANYSDQPTEFMQGIPGTADSGRTVIMKPEKQSNVLAWLILTKGDPARLGTTFRLNDGITEIGRDVNIDIIISDEAASNYHAKVRIKEGKFMLYDLVTTNGTFVNGKEIDNSIEIKENDKIQIGEAELVFKKIL